MSDTGPGLRESARRVFGRASPRLQPWTQIWARFPPSSEPSQQSGRLRLQRPARGGARRRWRWVGRFFKWCWHFYKRLQHPGSAYLNLVQVVFADSHLQYASQLSSCHLGCFSRKPQGTARSPPRPRSQAFVTVATAQDSHRSPPESFPPVEAGPRPSQTRGCTRTGRAHLCSEMELQSEDSWPPYSVRGPLS